MSLILYFFYSALIIAIFRLAIRLFLSSSYNLRGKVEAGGFYPPISIVVPAYNEEVTIESCLHSLFNLDYPDYEVILVDDGSTDNTLQEAKKFEVSGVKVVHQENQGKAKALNNGIKSSKGEIVVTVDADTRLKNDSLQKIASRFDADSRVGAVAGNVKVDPAPGLLNVLQATEYTVGINLIRKAQSMLGCVMVVPGPIATFKREAVECVSLFSSDTFAEDFDITMKILKKGYRVEYEDKAIAYTEAPKHLEDFLKQRRRWYRGMIQVLDKHQDMYLRRKYGLLGMIGVPNLWFDIISPILTIALIFLALLSVFFLGESFISLVGLVVYFSVELVVGIFAVGLDPMPKVRELIAIPLLLFYNVFLDGVRLMALAEEMVNVIMKWEKPRR
jgi:cellulose synthase/poly-beta-1,6-N-acetylglucosamine synthase-like glycosyltransferase